MSAHENFLAEFKKNHPDREVIFLMVAGSHFFDLNGPKSDYDYRGIYMPSMKEFYNGEGKRRMSEYKTKEGNKPNVKNDAGDVDFTMFSITKFLDLLASGDFKGLIEQDELFGNIDRDIEELYAREKQVITNREQIRHIIDKLIFRIEGEQRIKYILANPLAFNEPKQRGKDAR